LGTAAGIAGLTAGLMFGLVTGTRAVTGAGDGVADGAVGCICTGVVAANALGGIERAGGDIAVSTCPTGGYEGMVEYQDGAYACQYCYDNNTRTSKPLAAYGSIR